jgi:glutamate racemase
MKIGIFDSGFGGLSIFKSIEKKLPAYDYLYLGDNARTPYGNRSFEAIYRFTQQGIEYLFSKNCQLIIIACNTASAKALRSIQQKDLPLHYPEKRVLGIIRPSVEAIAGLINPSPESVVALWATEGTVKSNSYVLEMQKLVPQIKLVQQACPLLVPLVEAGEWDGQGLDFFIQKYWQETLQQSPQIDTLLLACTHYPLIYERIRRLLPSTLRILTQGDIVADSLKDYLQAKKGNGTF